MIRRSSRHSSDRGAALVEMALILPLMVLLAFGIIEFGWLLSQNVDARSGTREAARLIAVNGHSGPGQDAIITQAVCDSMDAKPGTVTVTLSRTGNLVGDAATATVQVAAGQNTLTGFFSSAIPPTMQISQTVETRLVKLPTWTNGNVGSC